MYTHTRKPIYIYIFTSESNIYKHDIFNILCIYIYIYEQKVPSTCGGSSSQDPQRPSPCGFLHLKMPAMQLSMRCCRACNEHFHWSMCNSSSTICSRKKKNVLGRGVFSIFSGVVWVAWSNRLLYGRCNDNRFSHSKRQPKTNPLESLSLELIPPYHNLQ